MSDFTKDKWTVPLYTRRDGNNRCWVMQGKTSICRTFGKPKIAEANAHLIASAPTLKQQRDDSLAALKQISDIEDERYTHAGFDLEVNNISKAAIAKCET